MLNLIYWTFLFAIKTTENRRDGFYKFVDGLVWSFFEKLNPN